MSAISKTDAWAVGFGDLHGGDPVIAPLIAHWDGSAWTQVQAPSLDLELDAVSAVSASDAWAVGTSVDRADHSSHAVTLHWDGTSWTQVPAPKSDGVALAGVSAVSATDAWAVGTSDQAYVIRWDGSQWTQVTSPGDAATVLTSISAASDSDVWAAGQDTDREQQLLAHWDGSSWTRVPTLSSIFTNGLHAVTVSAGVGWVAGSDDGGAFAAPILAVPDVAQNTAAKATAAIQAAALRADNTAATSNCGLASNGLVVGTSPAAGQVLPFGSQVTLNICHPNVTVPDVFGDTPAAAQTALQNASLTFSGTTVTNSCGPDDGGLVVGTDPPSGRPVPIGTAVTLTVCNTTAVHRQPDGVAVELTVSSYRALHRTTRSAPTGRCPGQPACCGCRVPMAAVCPGDRGRSGRSRGNVRLR